MPRRKFDFYETPPHYIAALLGAVNIFGTVFEPCVGERAIADSLDALPSVRRVFTNDLDPKRPADTHLDATDPSVWGGFRHELDWIITNPPFSDEQAILEHALDTCPNVAFLARLSFLEPTEDHEYLLESRPPQQIIVLPRYSFRLNDAGKPATDNVTCCWLVWLADGITRDTSIWGRSRAKSMATFLGVG